MNPEPHRSLAPGHGWRLDLGATLLPDGTTRFRVWAPRARELSVLLPGRGGETAPLAPEGEGYFVGSVPGLADGELYLYLLDRESARPDPASRCQPQGVHGPSQLVARERHPWRDGAWTGLRLDAYIIYELHVGTFTSEGSFEAVISRLDYLCELGVTALELMPVAQFAGERNWGYDGCYPFAPQMSYGGPDALKRLVDACHQRGLVVILDVVYNHLGPEGNYLGCFGPYFTDRYHTPWGEAINFDGPDSDQVRHYFIANALYWIEEFHVDALRLDAVHGIYDLGARHILEELTEAVRRLAAALRRRVYVIAESDQNDVRLIRPSKSGGYGLDAQWNDDFHHALRSFLTGELTGYYADFGEFSHLVKGFSEGFVLSGGYSSFRRRCHGSSSAATPSSRLVVFSQNHDQVGNRMRGERPGEHLGAPQLKLAAALVLLSPYIPLLFMGEEYAEKAPFPYFVSHGDQELVQGVREGRLREFAEFAAQGTPPDPQAEETFSAAKLDPELRRQGEHAGVFDFYRALIRLRKECPALARISRESIRVVAGEEERLLAVTRSTGASRVLALFNLSDQSRLVGPPLASGTLRLLVDSTGEGKPGSVTTIDPARPESFPTLAPFGVRVYQKE